MCASNRRSIFWGVALIGLAMISIFADWTDGTFWAVFLGVIAMSVADQRRMNKKKGC